MNNTSSHGMVHCVKVGGPWGGHRALTLTHDVEAQHTGVGGPLPVFALEAVPQQFTPSSDVPCWSTESLVSRR